jgi:hypothetical protein
MARAFALTAGPEEEDDCAAESGTKIDAAKARQSEAHRLYRVMGLDDGYGK